MCILLFTLTGCGSTPYSATDTLKLTAAGPVHKLVIDNPVGGVDVRADASCQEVRAEAVRVGRGATQAEAHEALQTIDVTLAPREGDAGTVLATARLPRSSPTRNYSVRWRIVTPAGAVIDSTVGVGNVRAIGFSNAIVIKTDVGAIEVICDRDKARTAGPVKLTTGVGDILAENIGADLSAVTGVGKIRAAAGGKINLRTDVGQADLTLLPHNPDTVLVQTNVGDIRVHVPETRPGKLVADADVGSLSVFLGDVAIRNVRQRSHHFSAELAEVGGPAGPIIDLTTDVGDVMVRGYDAQ